MKIGDNKDTVVVELKILCVIETWHEKVEARANSINFWLNESSHCTDNEIRMLGEIQRQWNKEMGETRIYHRADEKITDEPSCFCTIAEGKYIREATEEDHRRLGYDTWKRSKAAVAPAPVPWHKPGWLSQLWRWWFSLFD